MAKSGQGGSWSGACLLTMAAISNNRGVGRCPRCEVCGVAVRTRGLGQGGVWCPGCTSGALPFVGLAAEGEYRGALREYREGLGSRAGDFVGLRFDPFDDEVRGALGELDAALRGCGYVGVTR